MASFQTVALISKQSLQISYQRCIQARATLTLLPGKHIWLWTSSVLLLFTLMS